MTVGIRRTKPVSSDKSYSWHDWIPLFFLKESVMSFENPHTILLFVTDSFRGQ
ncbi:Hypothetical protein FKW44_001410 [Caligus rogercresseyi]|uniref:Uncharacterized protein n=1 Tax=Caligus rogercresseyi TaxID=217165 RepID=A0A7T8KIR9_CALRO|nr:Hypothetical protein FKW44_001410 [Caligus rogercresseyi]